MTLSEIESKDPMANRLRYIATAAQRLINEAHQQGIVLTIDTKPRPELAMGNYDMVYDVRVEKSFR